MNIQLWRNATLKLTVNGIRFLIDPMLGPKGSLGLFPWIEDGKMNPLVNLPFTEEALIKELKDIDVVVVSHLHPDHWDATAVQLLDKTIPVICPCEIAPQIKSYGFSNVKAIDNVLTFQNIDIYISSGQHGTGEIGDKMGKVYGFVLKTLNSTIYLAGDTIWCSEVADTINKFHPKHIIVAGGAATFAFGKPVTMTVNDIKSVATLAQSAKVWITHLEAISPCTESRHYIKEALKLSDLDKQCLILEDGAHADLVFD